MPIYEFECAQCKKKSEMLVRSNAQECVCPHCGSSRLKKLISSFAFTSRDSSGNVTARSSAGCSGCAGGNCSHCAHSA